MTREEILAMKAGLRLDKLIAKEVFGIVPFEERKVKCQMCDWEGYNPLSNKNDILTCPKCGSLVGMHPDDPSWNKSSIPDKYSIDISAAWQLVEKVKSTEVWEPFCHSLAIICGDIPYYDGEDVIDIHSYIERFMGEITPEAICKATLLAKLEG